MYLTEEQKNQREGLFFEFIEIMAQELYNEVNENYEISEEEAYLASLMMEHFVENYIFLSLKESAILALTGAEDPNLELYEEFIDLALDESLGGAVSGAVHGIRNLINKYRAKRAAGAAASTLKSHEKLYNKMRSAKKDAKKATGLSGTFKKAKAASLEKRRNVAFDKASSAYTASKDAQSKHIQGLQKRAELKRKIDTGVSNIKNKVKGAVKSGAERVASVAGRVAGSLT